MVDLSCDYGTEWFYFACVRVYPKANGLSEPKLSWMTVRVLTIGTGFMM